MYRIDLGSYYVQSIVTVRYQYALTMHYLLYIQYTSTTPVHYIITSPSPLVSSSELMGEKPCCDGSGSNNGQVFQWNSMD